MSIDYRELLKKYMRHIYENEGGTYIYEYSDTQDIEGVTQEEIELLKDISQEVEDE